MRKKLAVWSLAALLLLGLTACSGGDSEDAFTVRVVCESPDVYQIFYTCYLGDEAVGMGGMADLEGGEITEDTDLTLTFPAAYFEDGADLSQFAMDSPPMGRVTPARSPPRRRSPFPLHMGRPTLSCSPGTRPPGSRRLCNPSRRAPASDEIKTGSGRSCGRGLFLFSCSYHRFQAIFISTFPSMPGTLPLLVYCHIW